VGRIGARQHRGEFRRPLLGKAKGYRIGQQPFEQFRGPLGRVQLVQPVFFRCSHVKPEAFEFVEQPPTRAGRCAHDPAEQGGGDAESAAGPRGFSGLPGLTSHQTRSSRNRFSASRVMWT
jgi:hypothetical protein